MTDADRNVSKPASVTVVSAAAPSAPSGLALSAEGMAVDLDWNANPEPNIAGYRLWRHGAPVHTTQLLTGLTAHASDNTLYANRVLDGRDWTYWSPNTVAGAWLTLSWPEARLVNEVIVQWYSADFRLTISKSRHGSNNSGCGSLRYGKMRRRNIAFRCRNPTSPRRYDSFCGALTERSGPA